MSRGATPPIGPTTASERNGAPAAVTAAHGPLDVAGLADRAYRVLRAMILRRVHPPGSRLDIQEIARQMGISTAPLRDAVRRLESEGLVQIHPRHGTFVTEITADAIRDVFEVRRALELAAVQTAVRNLDEADFEALHSLLERLREWLDGHSALDYDEYLGIDAEFHRQIAAASRNRLLLRLHESLQAHTHVARAKYVGGTHQRWESLDEHRAILSALRARDLQQVERAVRAHLDSSEADLVAHLARSTVPRSTVTLRPAHTGSAHRNRD